MAAGHEPFYVPGELLVKYKKGVRSKLSRGMRQKVRVKGRYARLGVELWKSPPTLSLRQAMAQLKNDPAVEVVEPNYRRYPRSSHTAALSQANARLEQIRLTELWEQPVTRTEKVKIAVIDDAFDIQHSDLRDNIVAAYDAVNDDNDPGPSDDCTNGAGVVVPEEHGTMVLGVLGAVRGNDIGIDGASDNAALYPIGIGCNYTVAAELAAVEWAISQNVDIINASYGGPMYSELERQAFQKTLQHKIVVVVAAGNFELNNDWVADYPSGLDLPNILAVSATDAGNELAPWAQWGQTTVDIAAPGEYLGSTSYINDGYVANIGGTSFSAPLVTGVLASLIRRDPFPLAEDLLVYRAQGALLAAAQTMPNTPKARLATDGYADAMAAYEKLQKLEPVIVIRSIMVDDSETGNDNGAVEPGESVVLRLTLENKGMDATEFQAYLSSPDIPALGETKNASLRGFDSERVDYGSLTLDFPVDFSGVAAQQAVPFQLDLSGTYLFGTESFAYSRYFSISTAALKNAVTVEGTMRDQQNAQADMHLYHIDIPRGARNLVIRLVTESNVATNKLDVLAKAGEIPQFDYLNYPAFDVDAEAVAEGVLVG